MSTPLLHEIFRQRAAWTPEAVAVTAPDGELTYAELDARSDALATRLAAAGVAPGALIGLCAGRGAPLIVGLLGILKAGAAYVPIDAGYPPSRIALTLSDAGVAAVVGDAGTAGLLAGGGIPVVRVDEPAGAGPAPELPGLADDSLAYVIYTSGSTGRPKGVLVTHRNAVHMLERTGELFELGDTDVWTVFHSIGFDFSVWEIWGALLFGGRLVLVSDEVARTPKLFHALLGDERVTVLSQTPSAFRQLTTVDAGAVPLRDLRLVVFGGERLAPGELAGWIQRYGDERPALVNMYGITETTVHVTHRRIRAADTRQPAASPIGEPLFPGAVRLRDSEGRPVPDGVPGEIQVGGDTVARGYLNRDELAAERFRTDRDGSRWYCSGDLAVRTGDGDLHYAGRIDDQLKIRGFRVEPGEIEACLTTDPGVTTAVVTARDYGDGDVRLIAHLLPATADAAALVRTAARRATRELPRHMRPAQYAILTRVPLTTSGKVDRSRLDDAVTARFDPTAEAAAAPLAVAADNGLAVTEVAGIVEGVLQLTTVPRDTDIFDLGATSLSLVRIIVLVNRRFGLALTGAELSIASVHEIASVINAQRKSTPISTGAA